MDSSKDKKLEYDILCQIANSPIPLGANLLSLSIDSSQATIGRILLELEHSGHLIKSSNKGRVLTEQGKAYLQQLDELLNLNISTEKLIEISSSTDKETLLEVLTARRLLEKETAFLTAQNITNQQIEDLSKIIDRQEERKRLGFLGENEDLEFHCQIANIAGNRVIEQMLNLILTQKNVYLDFSYIRQKVVTRSSNDHRKIISAFTKKDPELASKYMVSHIESLISDIEKYYK